MTTHTCPGYPKYNRKLGGEVYELIDAKNTKRKAQRLLRDYKLRWKSVRLVETRDGRCHVCWGIYVRGRR